MRQSDPFEDVEGSRDPLQGQVLRRTRRRESVLFLRGDALWVADFFDGQGEVIDAVTWVRFNCGAARSAESHRRMVLESALPLDDELVARIEALQGSRPPERGSE
jgi:hypothetical protein